MKDRMNGSHLKRKHDINIEEYSAMFSGADLGTYRCNDFECGVCKKIIKGGAFPKVLHLDSCHHLTVHEYNIQYETKMCLCGCGELADYSYSRYTYNDYIEGHAPAWNTGLTKETNESVRTISEKGKLRAWSPEYKEKMIPILIKTSNLPEVKEKRHRNTKKAMLEKYGVENLFELKSTQDRIKKTNLQKYGYENPMQNIDIKLKSDKNAKEYDLFITQDGKECYLQGYDEIGLNYLLEKYAEHELCISKPDIPRVTYNFKKRIGYYRADFYIPSENRLIEIKSAYTYKVQLQRNLAKFKASARQGFNVTVIIFDNKKKIKKIKHYESKDWIYT